MKLAVLIALATIAACAPELPPKPPPFTPTDRDSPDTPIGEVCTHLRHLSCPEGFPNRRGRTCFESYTTAADVGIIPLVCLKAASSQAEVRLCGDANSIRVRCVMPSVDTAGSSAP